MPNQLKYPSASSPTTHRSLEGVVTAVKTLLNEYFGKGLLVPLRAYSHIYHAAPPKRRRRGKSRLRLRLSPAAKSVVVDVAIINWKLEWHM